MEGEVKNLYEGRYLSEGYPDLERIGVEYFQQHQESETRIHDILDCLERLIDLKRGLKTMCVVGCGPNPTSIRQLLARGYDTIGIEPVAGSVKAAADFLGDHSRILRASSENLSLPDSSQRVVLFESVLEHVDSPSRSLSEAYRVLTPGGVVFVYTTNSYRISLTGRNGEFNVPFFNWFPALVKEGYVFKHLHFNPRLANFSPRPAVHWFNFSALCQLGRSVGFSNFYSIIDLVDCNSPSIRNSLRRKWLLPFVQSNPWLRAFALCQFGNSIFMLKRENNE
jgi:ubiquinone/menaquinone biosynthesis C-methylase UbiE